MTKRAIAPSPPRMNRRVILSRRPVGIPQAEHFTIDEAPLAPLSEGQFLVRNIYLSVDPAQRGWTNEGSNYSDPVAIGDVMRALAVGVIVASYNASYPVGLHLYGWFGWQAYCEAGPETVVTSIADVRAPLSAYAGVLGINGLTAHLGLMKLGRPARGETILVSTAAGSVGSIVGQLARSEGLKVIGLTGDEAKVKLCTSRFGYHSAANYRSASAASLLDQMAPSGIDVFFDNTGGEVLDEALQRMKVAGRIIQCGTAAISNWAERPIGFRPEREILTRRLAWSGLLVFDHANDFPAVIRNLEERILLGVLRYEEHIIGGLEKAPLSIAQLYRGENRGKLLIKLP
jgi:NADPH-dependent curcumin reductase